ncbi:hypothetical protein, partial [Timonella senegalensis]|uniref:hypothetical protein n=1 Tax=Timonella senegalensis TaxID=1465825 RepID=UPI002FDC842F
MALNKPFWPFALWLFPRRIAGNEIPVSQRDGLAYKSTNQFVLRLVIAPMYEHFPVSWLPREEAFDSLQHGRASLSGMALAGLTAGDSGNADDS